MATRVRKRNDSNVRRKKMSNGTRQTAMPKRVTRSNQSKIGRTKRGKILKGINTWWDCPPGSQYITDECVEVRNVTSENTPQGKKNM